MQRYQIAWQVVAFIVSVNCITTSKNVTEFLILQTYPDSYGNLILCKAVYKRIRRSFFAKMVVIVETNNFYPK